jgi:hypothetical protein
LDKNPACFRNPLCHIFRKFVLWGYGITEVTGTSGKYSRFSECGIAAHQLSQLLNTSIAVSGHMTAQEAHPVHSIVVSKEATKYPLALSVFERIMACLGQNSIQSRHPLQRS